MSACVYQWDLENDIDRYAHKKKWGKGKPAELHMYPSVL